MRTIIKNGTVLDTATMTFAVNQDVIISDGKIVAVEKTTSQDADVTIDARGQYVMPGLIDAHVHFRLATLNFRLMEKWSEVEFGIVMARLAANTVQRGFTSVRDLGGDVAGLKRAIHRGDTQGPRITNAGRMLSQTGGHGDTAGGHLDIPTCACSMRTDSFSVVADGPEAIRKAARHLFRDGSDFLKMHASGGVATPMDPLESVQYTNEEFQVAVVEAQHRGTYVAAHAYTPAAITMAVENGVHSIEHGNIIDAPTAALVAKKNAVVVPTLVTYKAMNDHGASLGLPTTNINKNKIVYETGLQSLELMVKAGVTMGFGTDLIGETQTMQNEELVIRSEVQPAIDILRSMWVVNARLCRMEGLIGTLAPGAFGDVVISNVNPLEDVVSFANHETSISHVLKGGIVVKG
ncbi:MAG: amidohydrolase family protein [Ilumatobacteraceae bacterium]